jgi:hypothetical protein
MILHKIEKRTKQNNNIDLKTLDSVLPSSNPLVEVMDNLFVQVYAVNTA